jgi:predicted transcriptional regulator
MYTYILTGGGNLLISNQKSEYGELLTRLIKDKKMTQFDFYNKLEIKKPYFYDIIGGKINPPPAETQMRILSILKPKENDKKELLDIAARARNEIPADIKLYLENSSNSIKEIRKNSEYKRFLKEIVDKGDR